MKNNFFPRFVYTLVHGSLGLLTGVSLGGFLYLYCRTACFINPKKKVYKEFAFLCRAVLWALGTGFTIVGQIPEKDENLIVASNHTNWMDALFIAAYFNGIPGVVFLDAKMFKYPILRYFLKKVDAIAIRRNDEENEGKIAAFRKSVEILKKTTKHFFIFPEGTRTPDGQIQKFKDGAAKLAIMTRKKVLTLGLAGSYEFSNKKSWLLTPGKIVLYSGDVIEYFGNDKKELTTMLEQAIGQCVENAKKVRQDYLSLSKIFI